MYSELTGKDKHSINICFNTIIQHILAMCKRTQGYKWRMITIHHTQRATGQSLGSCSIAWHVLGSVNSDRKPKSSLTVLLGIGRKWWWLLSLCSKYRLLYSLKKKAASRSKHAKPFSCSTKLPEECLLSLPLYHSMKMWIYSNILIYSTEASTSFTECLH